MDGGTIYIVPSAVGEEVQEQNHNAHGGAVAKAVVRVVLEYIPIIGKADKTPHGQHKIGFRVEWAAQQKSGEQGTEEEQAGDKNTDKT